MTKREKKPSLLRTIIFALWHRAINNISKSIAEMWVKFLLKMLTKSLTREQSEAARFSNVSETEYAKQFLKLYRLKQDSYSIYN